MLATLTGLGLAAAAGLNAYIPFLVVALLARYTDVVTLPSEWLWMESWWAIGIGLVLLVVEFFFDKVPVVDTVNDAVQTVIRPASAAVIVAATTAASDFEASSSFIQENTWVPVALGIVVALFVHSGKAATRPVVNASTAGVGAPVLSTLEDGAAIGLSLVAIFLPLLVVVVLLAMVLGGLMLLRRMRRRSLA